MNTIMKAKYILSVAALTLALTGCQDYFDTKYLDNGNAPVVDIATKE